ncbi:MAG: glycerol-3-phosphate dehydrogenase/oxidase [Solitalea-like symbiont of Acarus siro]
MTREDQLKRLNGEYNNCDVFIIGGGATGLGTAVDATLRGYKTVAFEQSDFAKSSSSKSTTLVHGGLRYMQMGDIKLVKEALQERYYLLENAPHICKKQQFVVPVYSYTQLAYYLIGLKLYNLLSGKFSLGKSFFISKKKLLKSMPNIKAENLKGGVVYFDGQFDDSRLAVNLAQTAMQNKALVFNYMEVINIECCPYGYKIEAIDKLTDKKYTLLTRVVINATGVFADNILNIVDAKHKPIITPSRGSHIVISKKHMPIEEALLIPKTEDGRILFAIPWNNVIIVGTTDIPADKIVLEPFPTKEEIDFILETLNKYTVNKIENKDILSVFSGLRPLINTNNKKLIRQTKKITREHKIMTSKSGIISIIGGKWTTYRKMAEDVINVAIQTGKIANKDCRTRHYPISGFLPFINLNKYDFSCYGSYHSKIETLIKNNPEYNTKLHPDMPYLKGEVIWSVTNEFAVTVEDVLARRLRALYINARASIQVAPIVAKLMAGILSKDEKWEANQIKEYTKLAENYLV